MKNARIKLILNKPFIGSMTMGIIYQPLSIIPTACITGPEVFYNPDWIDTLNIRQTEGLWAHEIYHIGMLHHLRFDPLTMDQELWFQATDYAINDLLIKDGFQLPPGGLFGVPQFDGWAAERVYHFLLHEQRRRNQDTKEFLKDIQENGIPGEMDKPQVSQPAPDQKAPKSATERQRPDEKGPAPGSTGLKPTLNEKDKRNTSQSGNTQAEPTSESEQKQDKSAGGHPVADKKIKPKMFDKLAQLAGMDTGIGATMQPLNDEGQELSEADKNALEKQTQVKVMMNSEIGDTTWGSMPGFAKEIVENVKNLDAQRDYRDELRDILVEVTKDDYTWAKPNRRYIAQGIYLPSIGSENKGLLICAFDTSGSVGSHEKEVYATEVSSILEDFPSLKLYCIYADTRVAHIEEFDEGEGLPIKLDMKGGGGTSFHDTFKHIEKKGLEPKLVLYFSDLCVGESGYPANEPDYPVIWLQTVKGNVKKMRWGKVLELDPNLPRRT
jgi:predicted metal-dependent peptidase